MQKAPPTPKGFRDILPDLAVKRRQVIGQIVAELEAYGFVPIETPTIEFAQTLEGKYGEEERLIYKFTDRGGRDLALRYDLTIPLARFVASNPSLPMPFRRYQIGQVFRGENPQHGRWREFTQFDFDTVGPPQELESRIGSNNPEEDAKIIATAIAAIRKLGIANAIMLVNDRANFRDSPIEVTRAIDKLHKIGEIGIKAELKSKNMPINEIKNHLSKIKNSRPTKNLNDIIAILKKEYSLQENRDFMFDPTLARGLDYYTGAIFEMKPSQNPRDLTIGSGGRYDNLIGSFSKRDIPAVGFSFGLERLIGHLP